MQNTTAHSPLSGNPLADLQSLLRPPEWKNPVPPGRYNLVVVGGGMVGAYSAHSAALLGARVALVERAALGGSHYSGTVSRLALIEAARNIAAARRSAETGYLNPPEVFFENLRQNVREIRASIIQKHGLLRLLQEAGVDIYFAPARFADKRSLFAGDTRLEFSRALIATGAGSELPNIPGLAHCQPITRDKVLELQDVPKRLGILGAGVAGCEFAQAFARFGSAVTVYSMADSILDFEDAEAVAAVLPSMEREGVTFLIDRHDLNCRREGKRVIIDSQYQGCRETHAFDAILVAAPGPPHLAELDLDAAGVLCDDSGILVTDRLFTTNRRILAAGEVCSGNRGVPPVHALASAIVGNALFYGTTRTSSILVPRVTLTDPQIATVFTPGMEARTDSLTVECVSLRDLEGLILDSNDTGFLKMYHDNRGHIHGIVLVSRRASDFFGEALLMVAHRMRIGQLGDIVRPYPNLAEAFNVAGDRYRQRLLTPLIQKLLRKYMEWRR